MDKASEDYILGNHDRYEDFFNRNQDIISPEGLAKEIISLEKHNLELRSSMIALLNFIPEGWEMPLGFSSVAAHCRKLARSKGGDAKVDVAERTGQESASLCVTAPIPESYHKEVRK